MARGEIDERDLPRRLKRAAKLVCDQAKVNASFSRRIPAATSVRGADKPGDEYVEVFTDGNLAPNAAPFEYAEYHPLWGNRKYEYRQPHRAYMSDALIQRANAAAEEIAQAVDDWGHDLGFEDD